MATQFNRVVVVGARGVVGRQVLAILAQRSFPIQTVIALGSDESAGETISVNDHGDLSYRLEKLSSFSFLPGDLVFFCAGSNVSKTYAPQAVQAGATVIDKSSHFRLDHTVPLIVPEINGDLLNRPHKNLIATPNCVAIPLAMSLKPLMDLAPLDRVVVSTYQSVSGAGKKGMDELYNQSKSILMGEGGNPRHFPRTIAFNVIPQIDEFRLTGYTGEEEKVIFETRKLLGPDLRLTATCVRVPVFVGHCLSVNVTFKKSIDLKGVRDAFRRFPGLGLIKKRDGFDDYATPQDIVGEDVVTLSRLRMDPSSPSGISYWIASDNLRKGAALNGVHIADYLMNKGKTT